MLWSGLTAKQDMPFAYKRNNEARSCDHCCRGKAIRITYSVCVSVALVTQRTKHRCRVILSSVASPDIPYFSTLSYKRHNFWKNVFNMNWLFRFSLPILSKKFLFLRRGEGDTIINAQYRSSCKVAGIIVRF